MYLFHIFRSLVPLRNPLGFGPSDLLALGLALTALLVIFGYAYLGDWMRNVARRTGVCMIALFVLPIGLRLLLLTRAPAPDTAEEFSSLLVADTLLHGRIRNPPHPLSEFFEAPLVEERPVYRSTLPVGDGLLPAIGRLVFRDAWAGILLGIGAVAALSYWMLRGWMAAGWALLGGAVAACAFGPLCGWTNGYWGGFVAALGGCMIVGALPRLRARRSAGVVVILAVGVLLELLARPAAFCLLVPLVVLAMMAALKVVSQIRGEVFWAVAVMFAAHFLFWYGMHAVGDEAALRAVNAYAGRDFVDDPARQMHRAVDAELNRQPGKQLVFVRRGALHGPGEWVHNSADIDASRIVWARDLGQENDRKLIDYYGGRKVCLLEPDAIPPRLRSYPATSGLLENVQ